MRGELRLICLCAIVIALGIAGCGGDTPTGDGGPGTDGRTGMCSGTITECGGSCVDTRFDPANCGGCGTVCGSSEICLTGACTPQGSCTGALVECSGTCVDPRNNPAHCGGCGATCSAGEVCNVGTCSSACGVGTEACMGRCVDTQVDPGNCGTCGTACGAGEVCSAGICALNCAGGTVECSAACVDLAANVDHCGMCDNACLAGTACRDGSCGVRPTIDTDGDTISDFDEAAAAMRDTDGDGTPDYMDDDSDGDGLTDAMEAGDADVMSPPVDSDGDGLPDFRDLDSDNDGLSDADETTIYMTDPTLADTDGDGDTDAAEISAGTDPLDPADTIAGGGDFVFDLPPGGTARTDVLEFDPMIRRADILFLIDTTGSMGATITGLRTELNNIISDIRTAIPDTAFGVARHADFPFDPPAGCPDGTCFRYGGTADRPFVLVQRITTNMADLTAGVATLTPAGGADGPESQIEAFYQAATGAGFTGVAGATWVPMFNPATGFDASRGHGMIGGAGFRSDAQPIIILATDITFHRAFGDDVIDATRRGTWCGNAPTDSCDRYVASFGAGTDTPKTHAATVAALGAIGARVFGLAVREASVGTTTDQRVELESFAVATGAYIDPVAGMCATGVNGMLRAAQMHDPDGSGPMPARSLCPLVFSTDGAGTGVRTGVVSALMALTSFVSFSTLHTEPRDDPATASVDETGFFVRGIPVRYDPGTCSLAPTFADRLTPGMPPVLTPDGTLDSFVTVQPGCLVSFQIVAVNDGFVPATCSDQIFNVPVIVIGNDVVEADRRQIIVRVPGDRTLCVP